MKDPREADRDAMANYAAKKQREARRIQEDPETRRLEDLGYAFDLRPMRGGEAYQVDVLHKGELLRKVADKYPDLALQQGIRAAQEHEKEHLSPDEN